MRPLLASHTVFLLRECGMRLRRRLCLGPLLLLLLGAALSLFYHTVNIQPDLLIRLFQRPTQEGALEDARFITALEKLLIQGEPISGGPVHRPTALILTGRHVITDTEVQLYRRVLQQMGYEVRLARYAETSSLLHTQQGLSSLSLLLCLSSSESSCMRRVSFSQLQSHQQVNLLPPVLKAFSDVDHGLCHVFTLPAVADKRLQMKPTSCGTDQKHRADSRADGWVQSSVSSGASDAVVNVFVLVTSINPLISFLHNTVVLTLHGESKGQRNRLRSLRPEALGYAGSYHSMIEHIKRVIREVLETVASSYNHQTIKRCFLCYQLLTFTLLFNAPLNFSIIQVEADWTFSSLSDESFAQDITRDMMLEDMLHFLLKSPTTVSSKAKVSCTKDGACSELGVSLSEDDLQLLRHIYLQMKNLGPFLQVFPSPTLCTSSLHPRSISDLLIRAACYHGQQQNHNLRTPDTESPGDVGQTQPDFAVCSEPLLRQIYSDPPLPLAPPFDPRLKEYQVEVPFDTVLVHLRPEPISSQCRVHLDEHRGPSMAKIPLGLGRSRISILVTGTGQSETIYTLHVFREERPGLPMFGEHVMCAFTQDCGLLVQPDRSCGLEPFNKSLNPPTPCSSGDTPGRWVVPCLSCVDNRTCEWREMVWQPDHCYYPIMEPLQLQHCLADTKLLFIGDSTNRGMMYFLTERLNSSLLDWEKVHDTVIYQNINRGRTRVTYSYYPQFWLESSQTPTFTESLDTLLERSQPLVNSRQTVLVVGGVQWLKTKHLRVIRDTLNRKGLNNILVVVKSLGMGFHLLVDGIRSLKLTDIQKLFRDNGNIITAAKKYGFEVIDTFSITMGRYKEFLQGRCACHFHEVEKLESPTKSTRTTSAGPGSDSMEKQGLKTVSFHVKGEVNQVYSEILLSRMCPN